MPARNNRDLGVAQSSPPRPRVEGADGLQKALVASSQSPCAPPSTHDRGAGGHAHVQRTFSVGLQPDPLEVTVHRDTILTRAQP